jgi:hypothetical protein
MLFAIVLLHDEDRLMPSPLFKLQLLSVNVLLAEEDNQMPLPLFEQMLLPTVLFDEENSRMP